MRLKLILVVFIVVNCTISTSIQQSTPQGSTYTAAVVEYNKILNYEDPALGTQENLNKYIQIINSIEVRNVDIIVFPEMTLNSKETAEFVPDIEDQIAPCDNSSHYQDTMVTLCTYARLKRKYIVVNIYEKTICPDKEQINAKDPRKCSAENINIYNTNVVFDRNGVVIAKYRKFNLFGEPGVTKPLKYDVVTFDTDFNVTFGMFICFDLMFDHPPMDLIKNGIKDIIFTTYWFSELPFLTAVQIQQSWAYENNVNLLAAGGNFPKFGTTGSGIYHGRFGALTATMSAVNTTKVLIATVPKMDAYGVVPNISPVVRDETVDMSQLFLKRDQLDVYASREIRIPAINRLNATISFDTDICHGSFCCDFDFNISYVETAPGTVSYHYRALAYSGLRSFDGVADGAVKVCAVVACTDSTLASCGRRFVSGVNVQNNFIFDWIKIETVLEPNSNILMMPNTLDFSIMPLSPTEFSYRERIDYDTEEWLFMEFKKSEKEITMELLQPRKDLLTFSAYARDFDAKPPSGNGNKLTGTLLLTAFTLFSILRYYH